MNRSIRAAAIGLFGGAMAIAVATGSASALNGPIPGHSGDQSAIQGNGIGQVAGAAAQSKQILPTNLNVAPSLLSVGSNDGWVNAGQRLERQRQRPERQPVVPRQWRGPAEWEQPQSVGRLWSLGIHEREDGLALGQLGQQQGGKNCHPQRT